MRTGHSEWASPIRFNSEKRSDQLVEAGLEVNRPDVETDFVMAYVSPNLGDARALDARMAEGGLVLPPEGQALRDPCRSIYLCAAYVQAAIDPLYRNIVSESGARHSNGAHAPR